MSFKEFKEHSVRSGLGTALCYMRADETKYHILTAVESLPAVVGSVNTIEFSSTTNMAITKVKGKKTTETVEINIPYNLDNIQLVTEIKDETIRFAYIDLDDFSGYEFQADVDYHLGEVGTDGVKVLVLELVITTIKDNVTQDLYDTFMDTISFNEDIPTVYKTKMNTGSTTETEVISKIITDPSNAKITVTSSSSNIKATYSNNQLTLSLAQKEKGSAILTVEASVTDNSLAKNTRTIKVIVE